MRKKKKDRVEYSGEKRKKRKKNIPLTRWHERGIYLDNSTQQSSFRCIRLERRFQKLLFFFCERFRWSGDRSHFSAAISRRNAIQLGEIDTAADTERSCQQIFARTLEYQPWINRAPCIIIIIIIIQLNAAMSSINYRPSSSISNWNTFERISSI